MRTVMCRVPGLLIALGCVATLVGQGLAEPQSRGGNQPFSAPVGRLAALSRQVSVPAIPAPLEPTSSARTVGASRVAPLGRLPLGFIENQGQVGAQAKFYLRSAGQTLWLTREGLLFDLVRSKPGEPQPQSPGSPALEDPRRRPPAPRERLVFAQDLVGANKHLTIEATQPQPGIYNFFLGNDPAGWRTGVRAYAEVIYRDVWPGIDLKLYPKGRDLEQEFVIRPGGDPKRIRVAYRGIEGLRVAGDGSLVITTAFGDLIESRPRIYQEIAGQRVAVEGRFTVVSQTAYAFEVGPYRPHYALVIDPTLSYATYLGGGGAEYALDIAVDGGGNVYVTGVTDSTDFPATVGTYDPTCGTDGNCNVGGPFTGRGTDDAFVVKMDPTGSRLLYATYLGGGDYDFANGITVDAAGAAYVRGLTFSANFPTTPGAFDRSCGTDGACNRDWRYSPPRLSSDIFVAKLDPSGSALVYSTFLGGSGEDGGLYIYDQHGIAVDADGNAYVAGSTNSPNFPTTVGAYDRSCGTDGNCNPWWAWGAGPFYRPDAFLVKLNPAGSALVYSTFLGGSGEDSANDVVVDPDGNAYVTGFTTSFDFPTTAGAFQSGKPNGEVVFVTKVNSTGSALLYSTFLGGGGEGGGDNYGRGIAVDASGNIYVTGSTGSSEFPTTGGALQGEIGGFPCEVCQSDAFVAKVNPALAGTASLVYSTYLGGRGGDLGQGIAVDASGNVYVTGTTQSPDFPATAGAFDRLCGSDGNCNPEAFGYAASDAFVARINAAGSALIYSSFLGGSGRDEGFGIAVDPARDVYVTGMTDSADFPTPNALQPVSRGLQEGFIARFSVKGLSLDKRVSPDRVLNGSTVTYTLTVINFGPDPATGVTLTDTLPPGVAFVSAKPSQGTCSGTATVICELGTLADGASATVTIIVTATTPGTISNAASVTGNEPDPVPTDNAATSLTTVLASADLSVTKTASPDPVEVGASLTYTVVVTNRGPDTATGVSLSDTLPEGVDFVSITPTQGTCSGTTTVRCDVGSLARGQSATVEIRVQVRQGVHITNMASVTGNDHDPDAANNAATATVACPTCAELGIAAMEVTQGIQFLADPDQAAFPDNSVPLIRGKRTLVRVYFRAGGPPGERFRNITGELRTFRCGAAQPITNPVTGGAIIQPINSPRYPDDLQGDLLTTVGQQREGLARTLNFLVPRGSIAPCVDLEVTLTSPAATGVGVPRVMRISGLRFEDVPPARVRLYNQTFPLVTSGPRPVDRALLAMWLEAAYPISELRWEEQSLMAPPGPDWAIVQCASWILGLMPIRWGNLLGGEDPRVRYYIMFNADEIGFRRGTTLGSPIGCGPAGTPASHGYGWWDRDQSLGDWYGAHEIGHTYGLDHTLSPGGQERCEELGIQFCPVDQNYPHPNGMISPPSNSLWGVDLRGVLPGGILSGPVLRPQVSFDLMSYGQPLWISDYTYGRLKDILSREGLSPSASSGAGAPGAGAPASGSGGEHLAVLGMVNVNRGTVELETFYRLPDMLPVQPRTPGPFSIRLLDQIGATLADFPFSPHPAAEFQGGGQFLAITELVPYDPATARIQIVQDGIVAAERPVSRNVPLVTMNSPLGGGVLSGNTVRVEWSAADPDGDPLVSQVLFSGDGGQTWSPLATGLTTTQIDLDISRLRGTHQGLFMVLVSDGVNTGRAVTPLPFVVPRKVPEVIIPASDSLFLQPGQIVVIGGFAVDPEDGILREEALKWSSDRDGFVGYGSALVTGLLSEGIHRLTLTATDSDGNRASASISAAVTWGPSPVPTAHAGGPYAGTEGVAVTFDGRGSSDPEGEALTFRWHFGDGTTGTGPTPTHIYGRRGTFGVSLTVTDPTGLSDTAVTQAVILGGDAIPPTTTAIPVPGPNSNGWNNTDVSVTLTAAADPGGAGVKEISYSLSGAQVGSGLVAGSSALVTIGAEGTTLLTFFARDHAGYQEVEKSLWIRIDKTPPYPPTATVGPAPNAYGWNSTEVTVSFLSAGDAGTTPSGVAGCTGATLLTGETAGTVVTATCTDLAGNISTPAAVTVRIDRTPPIVTVSRTPGANASGWNSTDVTARFEATDALSGVQGASVVEVPFVSEGTGQSTTRSFTDHAGNTAWATVSGINIDWTPPVISGLPAQGCTLWPPNHKLVQVATVTASDGLSGLTPGSVVVTGTSNEPEDGLGDGDTAPDIVITGGTVQLRAERSGRGTGRLYTLTATASDLAGNPASASATCAVPHDRRKP